MLAQVLQVPLFLHFWGAQNYGVWLILTAIPAYLEYANIGLPSAAVNAMTLRSAEGNQDGAVEIFSSALRAVLCIVGVACAVIVGALALGRLHPVSDGLPSFAGRTSVALTWLFLYVGSGQILNLLNGGLNAGGENAFVVLLSALSRAAELAAIALALFAGGSFAMVAGAMVAVRLAAMGSQVIMLRRVAPWLRYSPAAARWTTLRPLISPSLGYLAWGLGHALSLQGYVLVVGNAFGPVALVAFNTMRTLTRMTLQGVLSINDTVFVEIGAAFGSGEAESYRNLHNRACQATLWSGGFAIALLGVFGPSLHHLWTGGRIAFNPIVFGFLLAAVGLQAMWSVSSVTLSATNRHLGVAGIFACTSGIGVAASYLVSKSGHIEAPAAVLALTDLIFAVILYSRTLPAVGETTGSFMLQILRPPIFMLEILAHKLVFSARSR